MRHGCRPWRLCTSDFRFAFFTTFATVAFGEAPGVGRYVSLMWLSVKEISRRAPATTCAVPLKAMTEAANCKTASWREPG